MTLDFRINGQHLTLIGNPFVVSESHDFLEASFVFSDDWAAKRAAGVSVIDKDTNLPLDNSRQ